MVGVKTHTRDPGQDLAMDCGDQEGEEMAPRFLFAWEDGGAALERGFLCEKWLESGRYPCGGSRRLLGLRVWGSEKSGGPM